VCVCARSRLRLLSESNSWETCRGFTNLLGPFHYQQALRASLFRRYSYICPVLVQRTEVVGKKKMTRHKRRSGNECVLPYLMVPYSTVERWQSICRCKPVGGRLTSCGVDTMGKLPSCQIGSQQLNVVLLELGG
jgi:hypothetical protein